MHYIAIQKTQECLKNASPRIKEIMGAEATEEVIDALAKQYALKDQTARFTQLAGYVLLGFLPINKFKEALEEDLGMRSEDALHLAEETKAKIFNAVMPELYRLYSHEGMKPEPLDLREQTSEKNGEKLLPPPSSWQGTIPPGKDTYLEPVDEDEGPKVEGNVVDLSKD